MTAQPIYRRRFSLQLPNRKESVDLDAPIVLGAVTVGLSIANILFQKLFRVRELKYLAHFLGPNSEMLSCCIPQKSQPPPPVFLFAETNQQFS